MSNNGLASPGSSSYTSNTMHVGDGTWDTSRDDFLLPNLQGLNFATMRYNGMGNRFRGLPEYHVLILGHGVLAAIVFIVLVPAAILLAKFGHDWPGGRVSFKLHIYLNILTVFLTTVILVLGVFAVGPERSLSNPHHGIGVAIYVLILFQFLYGACWFRHERRRTRPFNRLPITIWLHRLLGRTTAILGFVEIGLGLTLYGSPKILFILYALAGAFLLLFYLSLQYYYMPTADGSRPGRGHQPEFYSDYGSYLSGSRTDAGPPPRRKEGHHWGRDILAAGGVVGAYEWFKHRRNRNREERDESYTERVNDRVDDRQRPPPSQITESGMGPPPPNSGGYPPGPMMGAAAVGSRRPNAQSEISRESWEDEKYSDRSHRPTWRDRMLEATGAFAVYEGARGLFGRRRRRDDDYDANRSYGSTLGGNQNMVSQTDVSRVQAGQAPESPNTPRVNMGGVAPMTPSMTPSRPPRRGLRRGGDDVSYDSREDLDRPLRPVGEDLTLRDTVREMGAVAGFREWNRQRRARREADRAEDIRRDELANEENFNRRNSNYYPRPQDASGRRASGSGTLLTGASAADAAASRGNFRPDPNHPPLPAEAGMIAEDRAMQERQDFPIEQRDGYNLPPPPPGPPPQAVRSDGYGPQPEFGSANMPEGAVYPDPNRLLSDNTMANQASAFGRDPIRSDIVEAAPAAGVAAAMANRGSPSRPPQSSRNRLVRGGSRRGSGTSGSVSQLAEPSRPENTASPPVSVKVRMHNDGRHVTLRRLNEQEAAAEREARRQNRRPRRGSSLSSGMEDDAPPGQRYRRGGPSNNGVRSSSQQPITNVPPPPAMSSSAGAASFKRDSELNLPPPGAGPPPPPQHSSPLPAPLQAGLSPPPAPNESGLGSSPYGYGTDTDSRADNNRRRRRAERAKQQQELGSRVEFQ